MSRINGAGLLVVVVVVVATAGCGGGSIADEVVQTYNDGSFATVASATDSELRIAAIVMETIYTQTGSYDGGDLIDQMESLGDGRLYPTIELRTVEATSDSFCVEGGMDTFVKHVRSGDLTPKDGGC